MFSLSGPRVYLEIDESRLFIGRLRKKKGYYVCDRYDEWPLTAFEVKDGVIFKPSVLYLLIRSFLSDYHLNGARAVVCCPYLAYWRGVDKRMPFFQAALYVSKAGLRIYALLSEGILTEQKGSDEKKFFHKDKLKSRFDFFCHFRLKNKQNLLAWLGTSSLLLAGIGVGLSGLHVATYRRGSLLRQKSVQIGKDIARLQGRVKNVSGYKETNEKLKEELATLGGHGERKWGLISLLHAVTKAIPANTWLDEVAFDKVPGRLGQPAGQSDLVKITGCSGDYQEILSFYKDIVGRGVLTQCSLNYDEQGTYFSFTIAGKVVY